MTHSRTGQVLALVGILCFDLTLARADDVRVVATPDGGRPIVARSDASGAIHLVYDSDHGPMYVRSTDGGLGFGPPWPVVVGGDRRAGIEYDAWDMVIGRGGKVLVALGTNAWKLKLPKEEWGFFLASFTPGSSGFAPVRNINRQPSEGFSLASDSKGNVAACWLADKLHANISSDDGLTFAPAIEFDPSYNPCNCCTTSASYGEDGRLAVLYREETGNLRDMYLVLWDQASRRASRTRVGRTPWKIDACPMTYFAVNPAPGGFVAAWPTQGRIDFARLDAQGQSSGPAEVATPGRSGMRTGVLALTVPDGRSMVAWKRDGTTGWQLYGSDGKPSGQTGSVRSPGTGVAAVVGKDGRFVLFQ